MVTETVDGIRSLADNGNTFAGSLVHQFDTRGSLSGKQWFFVEKLAREDADGAPVQEHLEAGKIYSMFADTADRLKFPKVRVTVNGESLVLIRAGDRAKFPGSINITDGGPFGDNRWYGRIVNDEWNPSRQCEDWVTDWLKRFADNPAQVAAEYGKMTGYCCFCNRPLTDDRSVTVGYGPICAEHWGLSWGTN